MDFWTIFWAVIAAVVFIAMLPWLIMIVGGALVIVAYILYQPIRWMRDRGI